MNCEVCRRKKMNLDLAQFLHQVHVQEEVAVLIDVARSCLSFCIWEGSNCSNRSGSASDVQIVKMSW